MACYFDFAMPHLEELEDQLGYRFGDRKILLHSLTHTSYGHEHFPSRPIALRDNERLEFLGDAVLDLIISDILLETFPDAKEGKLSKIRAAIVNEKTLAALAKTLNIQTYLRLGKGEKRTQGHEKASILSSTLEALIAAIYLDGGYHAVYPVVRHLFAPLLAEKPEVIASGDYKTALQEWIQARWKVTPAYTLLQTAGPDHAKIFIVSVSMNGNPLAEAEGPSKKEAEQNAARAALESLTKADEKEKEE